MTAPHNILAPAHLSSTPATQGLRPSVKAQDSSAQTAQSQQSSNASTPARIDAVPILELSKGEEVWQLREQLDATKAALQEQADQHEAERRAWADNSNPTRDALQKQLVKVASSASAPISSPSPNAQGNPWLMAMSATDDDTGGGPHRAAAKC